MNLIGIGGAHIDRIGRTDGPHLAGTSNPGSLSESIGGGVFNGLRVAALRQTGSVGIISARGSDSAGAAVERAIREAGFTDLSGVEAKGSTATYTAILDHTGELVTALADMAIYGDALFEHLNRQTILDAISDAKAILIDANVSESAISMVCGAARGPIFGMAISASKVAKLKAASEAFDVVFMNHHEARHLSGQQDIHLAAQHCVTTIGFKNIVVTQGAHPVLIGQGDQLWSVEVPMAKRVDVTGAGDALCGGTIAALLRDQNLPLPQAVREGIACSALTLGNDGPVCPAIATDAFADGLMKVSPPTQLPTRNA